MRPRRAGRHNRHAVVAYKVPNAAVKRLQDSLHWAHPTLREDRNRAAAPEHARHGFGKGAKLTAFHGNDPAHEHQHPPLPAPVVDGRPPPPEPPTPPAP